MQLRPRRAVEIGSGYSSCATMDVNDLFFENAISISFIEQNQDLLYQWRRAGEGNAIP